MNKLRWGKFYWSDWADDPALALCSHAAQGVWMRLLCIAAQGTPYGHVTVNGKAPSIEDLAKLVRPALRPARMERIIAELERRGVVKRTSDGCLFSARLTHDWRLVRARSDAAKSRWNKETDRSLHMQSPNGDANFASPESHTTHNNTESPPYGPRTAGTDADADLVGGGGRKGSRADGSNPRANGTNLRALDLNPRAKGSNPRRQPSRNGFVDIALDMIAEDINAETDDPRPGGARVVDLARHIGSRKPPP